MFGKNKTFDKFWAAYLGIQDFHEMWQNATLIAKKVLDVGHQVVAPQTKGSVSFWWMKIVKKAMPARLTGAVGQKKERASLYKNTISMKRTSLMPEKLLHTTDHSCKAELFQDWKTL